MNAHKIVVFHAPDHSAATHAKNLEHLDGALHLTLPERVLDLKSHEIVTKTLDFKPHVILFDIVEDFDYTSFIDHIEEESGDISPTMLGLVDYSLEKKPCNILTKLPLDSYLDTGWDERRIEKKLNTLIKHREHNEELQAKLKARTYSALSAASAASEISLIMQLVDWLQDATSLNDVANSLFNVCSSLQLNAFAMTVQNNERNYFPEGGVHEAARKIMEEAHASDIRVLSKNRVLVIRLEHLVLFITNAPWEDESKHARLRDILLQSSALAESCARTIIVNTLAQTQRAKIGSIMEMMKSSSAETQMYSREIMNNLAEEIHIAAMTLNIEDNEEAKLQRLSAEAFDSMEALHASSEALEQHFRSVIDSMIEIETLTKQAPNNVEVSFSS